MSTYKLIAIRRITGQEVNVTARDDYFGHHEYGYEIDLGEYSDILTEEQFHKEFEPVIKK